MPIREEDCPMRVDRIPVADCIKPGSDVLCKFDFSSLDELDPSLIGGWQSVYDREIPAEIRLQSITTESPSGVGTVEAIQLKILIKVRYRNLSFSSFSQGSECKPEKVKLEISSDNDLFLHYTHLSDEAAFKELSQQQHLLVDLVEYPAVIMKMANSAIREPHLCVAVILLKEDGSATLSFVQNMEYKFVELLTLKFNQSPEDLIRQSISFRFHVLKSKLAIMHARLQVNYF